MSSELLAAALDHHQAGRFPQAEQLYRQVLQADPNNHEAWHLLGLLAHQVGQNPAAVDLIGRAVQLAPQTALYFSNLGLAWEALNQTDKALYCYQQSIELDPNFADGHNNLGVLLQLLGRLPEAAIAAQRAVQLRPDYAEAHNNLGNIYHAQKRHDDAARAYQQALRIQPHLAAVHANLANVLADQGRYDEAEAAYREALRLDPSYTPALTFLGNLHRRRGRLDQARACYQQVIQMRPQDAMAHCNLGVVLADTGSHNAAADCYREALRLDPNHAEAHNNLANLLAGQGSFVEAETASRRAVELRPQSAPFWNNLGTVLQAQGRSDEARQAFSQALQLDPDNLDARCNLGVSLYSQSFSREAAQQFERALVSSPDSIAALSNLATVYADQGRFDEALALYARAQALSPKDGRRVRMALLTHVMYDSAEEMAADRTRIAADVARLRSEPLHVVDPVNDLGATTFHLSYHAANDREILTSIAALHRHAASTLTFTAPHIASPASRAAGEPPRVGFLSRYFHQHPVGQHYAGVIERLPRDLHLTVFTWGQHDDAVARQIARRADELVRLPTHLGMCQQLVAARRLDLLVFPEIGMDPITYFLAFARLARVQAVAGGHPVTSGIDTVDYFLSNELLEPDNGQDHYSERLVRFRNLPNRFALPERGAPKSRRDFNLPEGVPLYLCTQTLFKIHPDFDSLVADILQADPTGQVVFFADAERLWAPRLQQRLARRLGDRMNRVLWLPRQSLADFREVLSLVDGVLDTPHFSGGTTSLETLAAAAPLVTLPGEFMRGRVTAAMYGAMGMNDLIAESSTDYVQRAVRLANDRAWRDEMKAKIVATRGVLFDNDAFAAELADWLRDRAKGQ